jgi:acetylornithine deacetylase/succinyl-diaminopimelate desuccinylase-like protein
MDNHQDREELMKNAQEFGLELAQKMDCYGCAADVAGAMLAHLAMYTMCGGILEDLDTDGSNLDELITPARRKLAMDALLLNVMEQADEVWQELRNGHAAHMKAAMEGREYQPEGYSDGPGPRVKDAKGNISYAKNKSPHLRVIK